MSLLCSEPPSDCTPESPVSWALPGMATGWTLSGYFRLWLGPDLVKSTFQLSLFF